jgi:hypothetical protein
MSIKTIIYGLALATAAAQADQCVLQDKTVLHSTVTIAERSLITATVVPEPTGGKRCLVNFQARVGSACTLHLVNMPGLETHREIKPVQQPHVELMIQ